MTVRRNESWGHPGPLPPGSPVVGSDSALGELVAAHGPGLVVGLTGGDLFRTLGGVAGRSRLGTGDSMLLPVDAVRVTLGDAEDDSADRWFVAHLEAHGGTRWRGPTAVHMNAAFIGDANLGPRAHPGDGLLDLTSGQLTLRDRRRAAARAGSGTHLPHPGLTTARRPTVESRFTRPVRVWLDGVEVGRTTRIRSEIVPDAITIVV